MRNRSLKSKKSRTVTIGTADFIITALDGIVTKRPTTPEERERILLEDVEREMTWVPKPRKLLFDPRKNKR